MVFFSAVFAARAPAMGNSADRAWQLSQLVEGVSTAFNPSHGSLSCVKTNCVSFASVQARKLNHSVCFSFPHEVAYFVGKGETNGAIELSRLRGSERYAVCFDARQAAVAGVESSKDPSHRL